MTSHHYNKQGEIVTLMEWGKLMELKDYRRVAIDVVNGYRVSTVLLGLDHNWGDGPPLIFETMVFKGDDSDDLDMERYTTLEQAENGHKEMVKKWREHEKPDDSNKEANGN